MFLALDINFHPDLSATEAEEVVDRIEKDIRQQHPGVQRIFIKAQAVSLERANKPPRPGADDRLKSRAHSKRRGYQKSKQGIRRIPKDGQKIHLNPEWHPVIWAPFSKFRPSPRVDNPWPLGHLLCPF